MADFYSGGSIRIDVLPDTTKFWKRLNADLRSRDPQVEVGVDFNTKDFYAELTRIDGQRADVHVDFDYDSGRLESKMREVDGRVLTPDIETKGMLSRIDAVKKELDEVSHRASFQKYWVKNNEDVEEYNRLLKQSNDLSKKYGNLLKTEVRDRLASILDLQRDFRKTSPFMSGADDTYRELSKIRDMYSGLLDDIDEHPALVRVILDEADYRNVSNAMRDTLENIRKVNAARAKVEFFEEGADRLEEKLERLRHQRVDIPADIELDASKALRQMREVAEKLRANPDYEWELDVDFGESLRRAETRIKQFKRDNDTLQMDLDLDTKLASAHMAYFTRPRTVDVFAKFHDTDFGKILNGMTSGATGLNGVENQFRNLVSLFDQLDRRVPVLTVVGGVISSLGAGMVNLSGTIGGLGSSILSMSKAALAAPAALEGMAAAGYVGYQAYHKLTESFKASDTALAGLNDRIKDGFWERASDSIYDLANKAAPALNDGLVRIAKSEGDVLAKMSGIAASSDGVKNLGVILDNTDKALQNMVPGFESLTEVLLNLGDMSSDYLPRGASYLSDMAKSAAAWVDEAERTGKVYDAMGKAIEQAGYLKDGLKGLWGVASGVFGAFADGENGLQGFSEAAKRADDAVNSVRFQDTLHAWRDGAQEAQKSVRDSFDEIGHAGYELRDTTSQVFADSGSMVGTLLSDVSVLLEKSESGISKFSTGATGGVKRVADAVKDAAPMFSDLLTMTGRLADTFGGTFAAGLRAASPLISATAKAATAVADAFDKLPEPLKSAMALYVTFGRAGKSAFDSLKVGMLDNIQRTLQYRQTMSALGVEVKSTSVSFRELSKAWLSVKSGGSAFADTASGAKAAASEVSGLSGVLGKAGGVAKSAGNALLAAFGGGPGLAVTAGVAMITYAFADYQSKAQATQKASEDIGDSLSDMAGMAESAADGIDKVGKTITESLNGSDYGETGLNWLSDWATGFDSVSDAAKVTGVSVEQMASAIMGGKAQFDALSDSLDGMVDKGTVVSTFNGQVQQSMDETARAASKQSTALQQMRDDYRKQAEDLAVANGHTKEYADSLVDAGEDATSLAIALGDQAQQQELVNRARQTYLDTLEQERRTQRSLMDNSAEYQQIVGNLGKTVEQVAGAAGGLEGVWDSNARVLDGMQGFFDTTTEAGQKAKDALDGLGDSAHDLLQSMVDSGSSVDEVKGKQQELAEQFEQTAGSMNIPKEAWDGLMKAYGLTPSDVDTMFHAHTEQAKADMKTYLSQLRASFPGKGNTAVYNTVLEGINVGALTSIDEVKNSFDEYKKGLKNGSFVTVITADNKQMLMAVEDAKTAGKQLSDGTYKVKVDAEDIASGKLGNILSACEGLNKKDVRILINGDDNASGKIKDVQALATALSLTPADINVIANTQGASDQVDAIRQKLIDFGLNNSQVDVLFQAITGEAKAKTDEMANSVKNVPEKRDTKVTATTKGKKDVDDLGNSVKNVPEKKSCNVFVNLWKGATDFVGNAWNSIFGKADGGRVYGPGTYTSDSIPTMLSTNEMVIRARSTMALDNKYGPGLLDYMNRYGDLPSQYAAGVRSVSRLAANTRVSGASVASLRADGSDRSYVDGLDRVVSAIDSLHDDMPTIIAENTPTIGKRDLPRLLNRR